MPTKTRPRNALLTSIQRTWWLIASLLLVMSGFRLMFAIQFAHPEIFREFFSALPSAFLFGVLHDLRILLLVSLPTTLSLLWMRNRSAKRWGNWLSRSTIYWTFVISFLFIALGADQIYYSYFQSHFNILAFGAIEDDIGAVLKSAWEAYPIIFYLSLILVSMYIVYRIVLRAFRLSNFLHTDKNPKPIQVDRAFNSHFCIHIIATIILCFTSLTPAFVELNKDFPQSFFVRSVSKSPVEELASTVWNRIQEDELSTAANLGFNTPEDAFRVAFPDIKDDRPFVGFESLPLLNFTPNIQLESKPHVVLVVMESFASHLLRHQQPNFDILGKSKRHIENGVHFKRFLPADNISAGSILGLITNLPYRPNSKQLSQSVGKNRHFLSSAADLFANQNYDTAFYYGGESSWRQLDEFLPLQNFKEIVGQNQIVNNYQLEVEKDAGPWGLWDEHLFAAVNDRLATAERPTFIVVFTTTNHPPNQVPDTATLPPLSPSEHFMELASNNSELSSTQRQQLLTYQYSNHELGEFLDSLEHQGILENTVVGITGDHTAGMGIPFSQSELLLKRAVPFILITPDEVGKQIDPDPLTPGSHKDVIPTLFHAAGLGTAGYRGLGTSLLDPTLFHYGCNADGLVIYNDGLAQLRQGGHDSYKWAPDPYEISTIPDPNGSNEAVNRYKGLISLCDWLIFSFSE
ncbi:MAG: LTA synthase family protein [Planctomycetota bacterium]|nr:LTA synthase family protein [Planctomycetota bacterium]